MQPLTESVKRIRRETWGIFRYTPTAPTLERPKVNDQLSFHRSQATIRVIIGPNRAGKTTPAVAEVAALLLNEDRPGWWNWHPSFTPKSPLTIWLGSPKFPETPLGDARLKRLFRGFWFTHPETGERSWVPPMIDPDAFLKNPASLDAKNCRSFESIYGDIIVLKSANQDSLASAGEEPDLIFPDEPTFPTIWAEYVARISQRKDARIIHTLTDATENNRTDYLDAMQGADEDLVQFFRFTNDNPHIDKVHHNRILSLLPSQQKRIRQGGETTSEVRRIYPFANRWHKDFDLRKPKVKNPWGGDGNWIPKGKMFEIPQHWTRYVVHDPGITNPAACHWFAIEPGMENAYVYRGLHWEQPYANFEDTIKEIFAACGQERYRAMYVDPKAMKRRMQFGWGAPKERRTIDLYNLCSSRLLGRKFRWAMAPNSIENMERPNRIAHLTAYLDPRTTSVPMMWLFDDGSPGMEACKAEFDKYHWAAAPEGRSDNPDRPVKKHDHHMYCLEVCATMGFRWFLDEGDDVCAFRLPADKGDPDGKLREFMQGDMPEGYNQHDFT